MKQRQNSRLVKSRKDKDGNLLCLVPICNNLRQKYKTNDRFRNYCAEHNCFDIYEFIFWPSLRLKALKRDNYTCVKCSDNRRDIVVTIKSKWPINTMEYLQGKEKKIKYAFSEKEERVNNLIGDHIIPIALGGEEFDINNVQTLCIKCNKIKTREDIKNIAIQRRKEKQLKTQSTFC